MFELRDAIRRLDAETDYAYGLTGIYEASELTEAEKRLIASMVAEDKDPKDIAEELLSIFIAQNAKNFDDDLTEDTVKQDGKWVNKGKEGTHGEFATKKEADAQRKAMFAQGYKEELNEGIETLDDFLKDAEVIFVDDAESFDINEWEKQKAEEMSEELGQKVEEAKSDARFVKYKLEDADVDKVIEKIKNSSINIVDYWKTNQFLKKRGLEKSDLDEVIHSLTKEDYVANSTSINGEHNEAVVFVKDSKVKDLGPFNLYIKLDYDRIEENPVIIISIHESATKDEETKVEEALHGMNEVEQFVKMADAIGLKTMGDVKDFLEREGENKDILTALYDYLHNEIGDVDFKVKEECLNEDTNSEWKAVASKEVEDSDGFLTEYVWYTNGNKHVAIFGDSDIYRPEDGNFDWEIDIEEGKEAEAYKEAQEWFDSYKPFSFENDNPVYSPFYFNENKMTEAQDVFDIQGQAVRDSKRKEVLDEFKEIFSIGENGEVNLDTEETLGYVRGFLEDQGYTVTVSESSDAEHPIHIEWFK